jgi:hypothetical protein
MTEVSAPSQEKTVITVDVKPDLSRFVQATPKDVADKVGCDQATADAICAWFVVLPR